MKGSVRMYEDVVVAEENGELTARLSCELDHHTARRIREKIDERIFEIRPRTLVLDFSSVGFMDSSGIGLILGRVECMKEVEGDVRLIGVSPSQMKLFRLSGIDRVQNLTISKQGERK